MKKWDELLAKKFLGNDTMPQQSGGAFFNRKKPDKASEKMKALENFTAKK